MANKSKKPIEIKELPILPVRDTVLFPNAILPLTVGRDSSLKLISDLSDREDKFIGVVAQRDPRVDNPQPVDLFQIGTAAFVHKIIKLPSQSLFIFVEGLQRIAVEQVIQAEPYLRARVKTLQDVIGERGPDFEALVRSVTSLFQQVVQLSPTLSDDLQTVVMNIDDPGRLADFISANLPSLSPTDRQELLESLDLKTRLERLNKHLAHEIEVQQLRSKIQSNVQDQVSQSQREYYLREQLTD